MINNDFWQGSGPITWNIGDLDNEDIVAESLKLTETLFNGNTIQFGCCVPSILTFKTMQGVGLISGVVTVIANREADAFTVGRFLIDTAEKNTDGTVTYTAYTLDKAMLDADFTKWYKNEFPTTKSKKTVNQLWADLRSSKVFGANGLIGDSAPGFINGTMEIPGDQDISYIDGRTLISDLCEITGTNATVDRSGVLRFLSLPLSVDTPDKVYTNNEIIPNVILKEGVTPKFNNIKVIDADNREIYTYGYVYGEEPYRYMIKDNILLHKKKAAELTAPITALYNKVRGCEVGMAKFNALADLAVEVGDIVTVPDGEGTKTIMVVNRVFSGTGNCKDTISCELNVTEKTSGNGSENNTQYGGESEADELYDLFGNVVDLPEVIRNVGFRLLDEPSNVNVTFDKSTNTVSMTWNDPDDISADEPRATEYAGTVIVRKQGSRPLNRWDGTVIDEYGASDKDKYASTPLTDTVDSNTGYYYGIFPYDDDGIVKHYRWTCTFGINTDLEVDGASITSATADGRSVTVAYTLPSGNYTNKLVYKANGIPQSISDGTAVNITGTSYTVPNLTATTKYGFIIFSTDSNNRTAVSNAVTCITGEEPIVYDFDFDYTGGIQTFTARQSGTYQLEVWGAQGQPQPNESATRQNQTLGGYSVGKIDLEAGDTLYVCVGGKGNMSVGGYNGGANANSGDTFGYAGGGATHIAYRSGTLESLVNNKDDVIIVAGGSGGAGYNSNPSNGVYHWGGSAGGFRGDTSNGFASTGGITGDYDCDAKQTAVDEAGNTHLFGKGSGGTGTNYAIAGSGGGWYGGYTKSREGHGYFGFTYNASCLSGGGSGYIGHPDLYDKCMYCLMAESDPSREGYKYWSDATDTKTRPFDGDVKWSAEAVSRKGKTGHGYAKIHYLG